MQTRDHTHMNEPPLFITRQAEASAQNERRKLTPRSVSLSNTCGALEYFTPQNLPRVFSGVAAPPCLVAVLNRKTGSNSKSLEAVISEIFHSFKRSSP